MNVCPEWLCGVVRGAQRARNDSRRKEKRGVGVRLGWGGGEGGWQGGKTREKDTRVRKEGAGRGGSVQVRIFNETALVEMHWMEK